MKPSHDAHLTSSHHWQSVPSLSGGQCQAWPFCHNTDVLRRSDHNFCLEAENIESHTAGMVSDTGHVLYQNDCCNELYTTVYRHLHSTSWSKYKCAWILRGGCSTCGGTKIREIRWSTSCRCKYEILAFYVTSVDMKLHIVLAGIEILAGRWVCISKFRYGHRLLRVLVPVGGATQKACIILFSCMNKDMMYAHTCRYSRRHWRQ